MPLAALVVLAAVAVANEGETLLERGRLIVFEDGQPVATERFAYTRTGDSLIVEAVHSRLMRRGDGAVREFKKSASLIVGRLDFGLVRYLSNQVVDSALTVVGTSMLPDDTVLTVYREFDGTGSAETLRLPPGRVFLMDPLMFSLFDVACRSLARQTFETRPLNLITLNSPPVALEAQVTRTPGDSLVWGGRRMTATRLTFREGSSEFRAWVNRDGQMIRFEANDGRVRVEREPPDPAPATAKGQKRR